ncbi:hypothetical protein DYH09_01625 [bacterium CPR1]|nr:hypothetical protein [bacterium CPR1]
MDLESLRQVGRLDSSGVFSLDLEAALEKMRLHQLSRPAQYILKLVQWAVGSGATRVDIRCGWRQVQLEHDGAAPTPEVLSSLLPRILEPEDTPTRDLAIGVNAALKLAAGPVEISTERGHQALISARAHQLDSLAEPPDRVRLRLRRQRRWWTALEMLAGTWESFELRQRCRFCPIPIFLNGDLVQQPLSALFEGLNRSEKECISYREAGWRWWKLEGATPNTSSYLVPRAHHVVELIMPGLGLGLLPSRASWRLSSPESSFEPPPPLIERYDHFADRFRRVRPEMVGLEQASAVLAIPAHLEQVPLEPRLRQLRRTLGRLDGVQLVHRGVSVDEIPSQDVVGAWALPEGRFDLSTLTLLEEDRREAEQLVQPLVLRLFQALLARFPASTQHECLQKAWLEARARRNRLGRRSSLDG